jgi:hypothetical protein
MQSALEKVTRHVRRPLAPRRKDRCVAAAGFLLLSGLSFATPAQAATRFVDAATGTDAPNCSVSPCKTIKFALTQAVANDTISVAAWTYSPTTNTESFPLVIAVNLTLTGAGAPTTTIDADGRPGSSRSTGA